MSNVIYGEFGQNRCSIACQYIRTTAFTFNYEYCKVCGQKKNLN